MMNRALGSAIALALGLAASAAHAQDAGPLQKAIGLDDLKIGGSVRLRYESYDGSFRPTGAAAADMLSLRTSIRAEYDVGPIRVGGELRDARGYLTDMATPFNSGDVNTLEPIQAYVTAELGGLFGRKTKADLTVGRFVLNLGSRRLAGDPAVRNAGTGFAGVNFDLTTPGKQRLFLFYAYAQQRLPEDKASLLANKVRIDRTSDDQRFWGIFTSAPIAGTPLVAEMYLYGLDEDDRPGVATRNRHLVTPGVRLLAKPRAGKVDAELELMHQTGTIRQSTAASAARVPVSAHSMRAVLGYSFAGGWKPRVSVLADYATGDDPASRSYNRFDALYGIRDSDWSPTGLFGPFGRSNIASLAVRIEAAPTKRLNGFLEWRNARLDTATDSFASTSIRDASGSSGRDAGDQYLAKVHYDIVPQLVCIDLVGGILAKGQFLRDAPNAQKVGDTHYGVADLTFKF